MPGRSPGIPPYNEILCVTEVKKMKKILITLLMILGLIIAAPLSSMAGGNHYGHNKHYNGYNNYHRTYFNSSYYYRPYYPERYIYYAPPPPVVYYEPAPYPVPYYYPPAGGSLLFGINID
jgi:hypothetical protein